MGYTYILRIECLTVYLKQQRANEQNDTNHFKSLNADRGLRELAFPPAFDRKRSWLLLNAKKSI